MTVSLRCVALKTGTTLLALGGRLGWGVSAVQLRRKRMHSAFFWEKNYKAESSVARRAHCRLEDAATTCEETPLGDLL